MSWNVLGDMPLSPLLGYGRSKFSSFPSSLLPFFPLLLAEKAFVQAFATRKH